MNIAALWASSLLASGKRLAFFRTFAQSRKESTVMCNSNPTVTVDLGSVEQAEVLYPVSSTGDASDELTDAIRHYLMSSLRRDGYSSSSVNVTRTVQGRLDATIAGDAVATNYCASLKAYLDAGIEGYQGSIRAREEGLWKESHWIFCLPHGVAMQNHKTVQLMHFPPSYVLDGERDYLASRTTQKWAALLGENGVKDTDLYQNIVDIAPIAAMSSEGRKLDGIYPFFRDYLHRLLRLWLVKENGTTRPMVAFGLPVRKWIATEFGVANLGILDVTTICFPDDTTSEVPILTADHPSFVYNARRSLDSLEERDDYPPFTDISEDERMWILMKMMQRNLIAARWQAIMGQDSLLNPFDVLESCRKHWESPAVSKNLCEITCVHGLGLDTELAAAELFPREVDQQRVDDMIQWLLTEPQDRAKLMEARQKQK